ncbi:MAG: hydroxymethylbilane synthase [Halobacteriaceae archaeon]
MSDRRRLRVATRGSALARRQTATVVEALTERRYEVDVRVVETEGDRVRDELVENLGTTGAFVRALDEEVLGGEADLAVHSMKDMPTDQPDDLVVAGVPRRASARDALVTPDGTGLDGLPAGAVVGTSSVRRRAQLLAARPDLAVEPLRGNVDTRVEKLLAPSLQREHERRLAAAEGEGGDGSTGDAGGTAGDGDGEDTFAESPDEWFDGLAEIERRALGREVDVEYDAVVLAEAGLRRWGLAGDLSYHAFAPDEFVPAPGQGALAVTARDEAYTDAVRDALDHPRTRIETTVERIVLAEVGGGCIAPVGVHAVLQGEYVHAAARVLGGDGDREVAITRDLPVERYAGAARDLAADLVERGADDLVAAAAEPADPPRGDGP